MRQRARAILRIEGVGLSFDRLDDSRNHTLPSKTHCPVQIIETTSPLPMVNLMDLVADEYHRKDFTKVLILGIKLTMQGSLYNEVSKAMTPIIPSDDGWNKTEDLIRIVIIPSKINSATVADIQKEIKQYDCDAIILGCTELPVVYGEINLQKPVIDTTRLLAHDTLQLDGEDSSSST